MNMQKSCFLFDLNKMKVKITGQDARHPSFKVQPPSLANKLEIPVDYNILGPTFQLNLFPGMY